MNSVEDFDRQLVRAKRLSPYAIGLWGATIGLGMVGAAGSHVATFPVACTVGIWLGLLLFASSVVALIVWHVARWPRWFVSGAPIEDKKPAEKVTPLRPKAREKK